MKSKYLLPNRLKKIGWFLLLPGIILGCIYMVDDEILPVIEMPVLVILSDMIFEESIIMKISTQNINNEIVAMLILLGSFFVAFSREKIEDEFIAKIRLESLVWATYINYFILAFAMLFIYGTPFFIVLVVNMFTILIFFIIRFNWAMARLKREGYEE